MCVTLLDIADVTYFVKPGQAMNEEAANRGTSVYLVDKRIDMLPSLLGTSKSKREQKRYRDYMGFS